MDATPSRATVELTKDQAAQFAHVSPKTIQRWIASGRLVARGDGSPGQAYAIDQGDLERAMQWTPPESNGQGDDQQPSTPLLVPRLRRPEAELTTVIGQAVRAAVLESLDHEALRSDRFLDEIRDQAQRIGHLEAELAVATAPKPARPANRQRPFKPRLSVPADPAEALKSLARRYGAAELARLAKQLE